MDFPGPGGMPDSVACRTAMANEYLSCIAVAALHVSVGTMSCDM